MRSARAQIAIALVLVLATLLACKREPGPVPVAYDRTPCTHCRMLVSDPRFAAQIQTRDGDVHDFDDPGCLMQWRREHRPGVESVWYRHAFEDRWLPESRTAFVPVPDSPMGFGLGAVELGTQDSIELAEAERRVAEKVADTGVRR